MSRRGETLELAVLGLLHEHPLHGYELRKRLDGVLGWSRLLSYGSLYPALQRALAAGLIREHAGAAGPAGAPAGRRRITYELTGEGRGRFAVLVADAGPAAWEDDAFFARFAFFAHTDPATRLRVLEGRRARLDERLVRLREQLTAGGTRDAYAAELHRHGVEGVEREVRWLGDRIAAERRARPRRVP